MTEDGTSKGHWLEGENYGLTIRQPGTYNPNII